VKNEIDNLRRYKFIFKEKFKSMLNLYLKMVESEDFEEKGNYKIEEEVSKGKAEKRVSGGKVDKLEGLGIENNYKIKETEDEQRYQ